MSDIAWFDTHFHLDLEDVPQQVFEDARNQHVTRFLVLGTSLQDCPRTVALASPQDGVYVAAGMHPHTADTYETMTPFREWLATPGAVAVGEIGLDYFYDISDRGAQKRVFAAFLELAQELKLPAVIHCRNAFEDCYDIVKATLAPGFPFLIHSFADTRREAELWLELGAMFSVNGMLTFRKSDNIREAINAVPLERILLETDSPYLAPIPHRGKRNCPAFIPFIGEKLADEKCCAVEDIAEITTRNACRFFNIA